MVQVVLFGLRCGFEFVVCGGIAVFALMLLWFGFTIGWFRYLR